LLNIILGFIEDNLNSVSFRQTGNQWLNNQKSK